MTVYLRCTTTKVWAFLALISIVSWGIGRGRGDVYHPDTLITVGVLLIAAIKSRLIIRHFMEVRSAPVWLKWATDGWLLFLYLMLSGFYWAGI